MYPVYEVPLVGGPLLIAAIATFHILPSHIATGAFWMTYVLERRALRENRPELLEFLKRFSLTVLIFCFVTGSLSGVGIWYAVTVISPRAISGLIHNYVWGWATEWVFFVIEIVAIYVYYYTFGRIEPKTHLRIGLVYAVAAWLSMVIITGILGFMMTPGSWLESGGFFAGFFNQTYWPQLAFRTATMFAIAGVYASLVAATLKNGGRELVRRTAGRWGLAGLFGGALAAAWYYAILPSRALENFQTLTAVGPMYQLAIVAGLLAGVYFLLLACGLGRFATTGVGVIMMLVLLAGIGGGESIREMIRRPYLIPGYMYSNQIIAHPHAAKGVSSDVERYNTEGILTSFGFVPPTLRSVTATNYLQAGEVVVKLECLSCHTLSPGGRNALPDILAGIDGESAAELLSFLERSYMPPFVGTDPERKAAAAYLARLAGGEVPPGSWVLE